MIAADILFMFYKKMEANSMTRACWSFWRGARPNSSKIAFVMIACSYNFKNSTELD